MDSKQLTLNDFQIIRDLGAGSFGKVQLVKLKSDKNIYAMKTVPMARLTQK